jgi:hypothetical protein
MPDPARAGGCGAECLPGCPAGAGGTDWSAAGCSGIGCSGIGCAGTGWSGTG